MSNIKKTILFILLLIVVGTIWICSNWGQEEFLPTKKTITAIKLGNASKPLYLKAKVWGVAGNHEEILLSQSNRSLPNKADDYIFYTTEIFYKVENDSNVIVYAPESSISEPLNKMSNVIIKGLKTADEINDYNINYQNYGLQRISVY